MDFCVTNVFVLFSRSCLVNHYLMPSEDSLFFLFFNMHNPLKTSVSGASRQGLQVLPHFHVCCSVSSFIIPGLYQNSLFYSCLSQSPACSLKKIAAETDFQQQFAIQILFHYTL